MERRKKMGTGSNTFGGTIKLEGEKEYREAISNINSDLKVFKSELKLVTSEFGANNKGAEALTAQNKILNSQITGQKNKVEEYKSALKSLTNQQLENKNKMNEVARQYDKSKEKLEAMKKSMSYTTVEIEKQEKEVKDLQDALKQSESQYNSCDKKIDTWKISLNQAQVELNKMEKELSENEKAMKDYENATKKEKKQLEEFGEILDDGQEKVNVFGDVLKANLASEAIINGIKTMAGVVKDFTVEAFNFGVEYQQSLNQIKASTNMTAEEMQGLEQVMKDVYMDNFGESIDDVGNSLSVIRTQIKDLNDEDLKSITEDAIALRDTFQYEVNESVRSAKALMDHFGVSGKEAYTLIAQGAQNGLDYSGEFLDNINEYSVQFKKLGFSAEDMFNIFESGTKSGAFNLDKIGDAVKEFSIRAIDGSNTTVEGFKKLGLNADKMAKKFASGGETAKNAFFEVIQKIGAMDNKVEQSIVGVDLFGTMWEDLGPEVVTQLGSIRDGYDKTADTMKKINEVKYDDVGSALEGIKRKLIVSISEPINKDVLPIINKMANDVNWDKVGKKVSEVVGQIVGWIEKWVKKFENLNTEQVLTIAKVGAFVLAVKPAISIIQGLYSGMKTAVGGFKTFKEAMDVARGVTTTTSTAVSGLAGVFSAITSPVGLACLGIVAAIGGIATAVKISEASTKEAFTNMGNGATDFINGIDTAKSHLGEFNSTLFASSEEQQELQTQMDEVQKGITNICKTASDERRGYTQEEITQLDEYFTKLRELNQRELEIQQEISNAITQQATTNAETFQGTLEEYEIQSQEWIKTAQEQKDKTLELIESQTIEEIALLNQKYGEQADVQNEAYATEYNNIMAQKQSKIDTANAEVAEICQAYANGYLERGAQSDGFYTVIQEHNSKIEEENQRHQGMIDSINQNAYLTEAQKQQALEEANDKHEKNLGKIWKQIYKNMNESQEEQLGVWIASVSQTELYGGQMDEKTQNLVNNILDSYDKMPKGTRESMKNAMQPMLEEMEKKEPSLFAKAKGIADGILGRLKKAFDINSPSRKTRAIFNSVMEGAEKGIEDKEEYLYEMTDGVANHVLKSFNGIKKEDYFYKMDMIGLNKLGNDVQKLRMNWKLEKLQENGWRNSLGNYNRVALSEQKDNLDIDKLTYAFKSAIKDMTGKVILDDEKMGKFVIEKVEEAIY